MKKKYVKWLAVPMVIVVVYLLFRYGFQAVFGKISLDQLVDWLRSKGYWAALLGGSLIIIQSFIPFSPFILLAAANVLIFGLWTGFIINWTSAVIAALLMFWASRTIGREWANQKLSKIPTWNTIQQLIKKKGFLIIFLFRIFPVVPPAIVNLGAGVTTISFTTYAMATLIGKAPIIFLESMLSYDAINFAENKIRFVLIGILFTLVLYFGSKVIKRKLNIPSKAK
ncbi:TVP38/TMEM64 family protein [Microaerobacter geothermalis]|uniref:TVP38/TMEM64 family protein n=1 Tax=Microaerobacter geothermalis TaxID=674972 RepID=UPI001F43D890|nr:TVP38/TMEM64 family protein [Microaerobacter geothermalis]MCF6093074.1 TVP38/TMEM64 family protein [Microaerobacter geothermalis]